MNTSIEQADYFDVHTTVDDGKETNLPDYSGIEMVNQGLGDAYGSSPGPQFQPAIDAGEIPTAVHADAAEIPTAVHVQDDTPTAVHVQDDKGRQSIAEIM